MVTGTPLKTTAARLKACLDRKCPPKEDIDASLAHAENAFVAGDYIDARKTLRASVSRNKRYAATLPIDVSDLLRANSRVAAHLGYREGFVIGAFDVVSALRAGLPKDDPLVLQARIEAADAVAHAGDMFRALDLYRGIAKDARKSARPISEGMVRLRIVMLLSAVGKVDPGFRAAANREIDDITRNPDPAFAPFAVAVKAIRAEIVAKPDDTTAIDQLIQSSEPTDGNAPRLLYAPMINDSRFGARLAGPALGVDDQWVDIGFWIDANGRVSDVGTLRQSHSKSGDWAAPIITAIAGRRYAAITLKPGETGVMRVERYSLTAFRIKNLGSNIPQREARKRVEMLDLTK